MPKIRPNFNPGPSQLGLSGSSGKGDSDRSPGWRANYHEIDWPVIIGADGKIYKQLDDQLVKRGSKLIKRYG
jgi:hypothetical protein